jgi:hypothetical protein
MRLVCSYVSELRSLVIGSAQDRSMTAKVGNVAPLGAYDQIFFITVRHLRVC